jgi:hypothetical protein
MNVYRLLRLLPAALLVLATTVIPATAQVIPAQDHPWVTNGGAQIDFSAFGNVNLTNLLGSAPVNSIVTFDGTPLNSQLGAADTLVRTEQVDVTSGTSSTTVTIEALSMASNPDLAVRDGRVFHVTITLAYPGTGSASFTRATSDGGSYNSSFTVTPILTFTNTRNSSDAYKVDCSQVANACSFVIGGTGNSWTLSGSTGFDPAALGLPVVPAGVQIGSYVTVGRPRFGAIYPGIGGTKSGGYCVVPNPELENAGATWHKPRPWVQTGSGGAAAPSGNSAARLNSSPTGSAATGSAAAVVNPCLAVAN